MRYLERHLRCSKAKKLVKKPKKRFQKLFKIINLSNAVLVNYRKDGTTYKCWIQASPVLDETGRVVNFIAFEKEVA